MARNKRYRHNQRGVTQATVGNNALVLVEAGKRGGSAKTTTTTKGSKANRSLSMAWDENEALGIPSAARRQGLMSDYDRKDTLYKAYLNNVWISSAIDVIAKRITSGGYAIEEVKKGEGIESEHDAIEQLILYVNDDEDFLQLVRATITDLLIFGEAYWEVLYKAGKPCQLVKIDCLTMSYKLARNGQIIGYEQNLERSQDVVKFSPDEIIRWWLPDPRASKKALSPIERIMGPVDADTKMTDWTRNFFKKGARPPFWVELGEDSDIEAANAFIVWFREKYTGALNAHVPPVMYNGAKLHEFLKGSIDVDFTGGRKMNREEVLAGYLVPPATVGIIETGNIGGGTGESQDKSLQFNACDPIKQLFFEKFNYRIVQQGFKARSYHVTCRYADYRSDTEISQNQDRRIRNASETINEVREENGKEAYKQGGDTPIFAVSKEVVPLERLDEIADEQRQTAKVQLQTQQAQADMADIKVEQAKNPPPPPPMMPGMPPQGQPGQKPPQLQKMPPQGNRQQRGAVQKQQGNGKQPQESIVLSDEIDQMLHVIEQQGLEQYDHALLEDVPDIVLEEDTRSALKAQGVHFVESQMGDCTCDTCVANHGKVFHIDDVESLPPYHEDGCSCKMVPVKQDEEEDEEAEEREASLF